MTQITQMEEENKNTPSLLSISAKSASSADKRSIWSAHWVDIHTAAPQLAEIGVPIDLAELRQLAGNEETWNQEFCCQFLSAAEMWIPLELIAAARSPQANLEWDPEFHHRDRGEHGEKQDVLSDRNSSVSSVSSAVNLFVGADIGRKHDRTAIWIDERVADVAICRGLTLLDRMPFERQYEVFCNLLSLVTRHSSLPLIRRACIDQTGIGMGLVERLQDKFGSRVEGVTFTADSKERMSLLVRRRFEERLDKIPENSPDIERDLAAVKRQTTSSGNLRFDADRTDAGHADIYWAKALADLAADSPATAVCMGNDQSRDSDGAAIQTSRGALRPFPSIWDEDRKLNETGLFA